MPKAFGRSHYGNPPFEGISSEVNDGHRDYRKKREIDSQFSYMEKTTRIVVTKINV